MTSAFGSVLNALSAIFRLVFPATGLQTVKLHLRGSWFALEWFYRFSVGSWLSPDAPELHLPSVQQRQQAAPQADRDILGGHRQRVQQCAVVQAMKATPRGAAVIAIRLSAVKISRVSSGAVASVASSCPDPLAKLPPFHRRALYSEQRAIKTPGWQLDRARIRQPRSRALQRHRQA